MSTKRGRIQIEGFHGEHTVDREEVPVVDDDARTDVESRWYRVVRQIVRDRLALLGALIVLVMVVSAIFARPITAWGYAVQPIALSPFDPMNTGVGAPYESPSLAHPMGTDRLGRDMLSRVMYGARFSVSIGLIVTVLAASFGVVYGGVSGYFGGKIDDVLMRIVDMVFAFPGLVLALVIIAMIGRGYWELVAAFALPGWAIYARLIRGEILKVKQNEYVLAAKALGARDRTVLFRHVVPNAIAPVIVQATLSIGVVVIGVAALGFLGLGFTADTPEWGTMLETERDTIVSAGGTWRWWATFFPGIMIFIFVMAMNMIGDAVNDALDAQGGETTQMGGG
ncbi:ABC transporter permease [Natronobeatus ordinarius]|uniref:ABC transporter permease n=1 Tax=Natronobeatus ordinarius TaxID=2963433 RepID=UPI0020CCDF71|nr:ABC transporter permease [Natronobeatus ordinarius]